MLFTAGAQTAHAQSVALSLELVKATIGNPIITLAWEVTPADPNYAVRIWHANPESATHDCDDSSVSASYVNALATPTTTARQVTVDVRNINAISDAMLTGAVGDYVCHIVAPPSTFTPTTFLRVSRSDFTAEETPPPDDSGDEMPEVPEMPTEETSADNTAADNAVLPQILRQQHRGLQNGIFRRILQRQREDGRWK